MPHWANDNMSYRQKEMQGPGPDPSIQHHPTITPGPQPGQVPQAPPNIPLTGRGGRPQSSPSHSRVSQVCEGQRGTAKGQNLKKLQRRRGQETCTAASSRPWRPQGSEHRGKPSAWRTELTRGAPPQSPSVGGGNPARDYRLSREYNVPRGLSHRTDLVPGWPRPLRPPALR